MTDTTIRISKEVKKQFDKQRTLPQGQVSADEYLKYLLGKVKQ